MSLILGLEEIRIAPQHPLELELCLMRQAGTSQRDAESVTDIVKIRAAVQRAPVLFDGIA